MNIGFMFINKGSLNSWLKAIGLNVVVFAVFAAAIGAGVSFGQYAAELLLK